MSHAPLVATLYERIGGEAAIEAAVVSFYERMMADPALARFFEHLDVAAQIRKQIAFMTMAFGGPSTYSGKDLRTAHARLGLADAHFDALERHMTETLKDLGVDEATTAEVLSVIEGTRDDVLGRGGEVDAS